MKVDDITSTLGGLELTDVVYIGLSHERYVLTSRWQPLRAQNSVR